MFVLRPTCSDRSLTGSLGRALGLTLSYRLFGRPGFICAGWAGCPPGSGPGALLIVGVAGIIRAQVGPPRIRASSTRITGHTGRPESTVPVPSAQKALSVKAWRRVAAAACLNESPPTEAHYRHPTRAKGGRCLRGIVLDSPCFESGRRGRRRFRVELPRADLEQALYAHPHHDGPAGLRTAVLRAG